MSYSFGMTFWEVKDKLDAFEKAQAFMAEMINPGSAKELIGDNLRFFRYKTGGARGDDLECLMARYGDNWLSELFTARFTFWPEYNLLGVTGMEWPKHCLAQADGSVYFQNSCDQDYPYEDWPTKIPFFKARIGAIQAIEDWKIREMESLDTDIPVDDVPEAIEYARRSRLYRMIYNDLELDKWLYGTETDAFQRFAMCAILNQDTSLKLYSRMRQMMLGPGFGGDFKNGR